MTQRGAQEWLSLSNRTLEALRQRRRDVEDRTSRRRASIEANHANMRALINSCGFDPNIVPDLNW